MTTGIAREGYKALLTALLEMTPGGVIHRITESGLRGRGGGAPADSTRASMPPGQTSAERSGPVTLPLAGLEYARMSEAGIGTQASLVTLGPASGKVLLEIVLLPPLEPDVAPPVPALVSVPVLEPDVAPPVPTVVPSMVLDVAPLVSSVVLRALEVSRPDAPCRLLVVVGDAPPAPPFGSETSAVELQAAPQKPSAVAIAHPANVRRLFVIVSS